MRIDLRNDTFRSALSVLIFCSLVSPGGLKAAVPVITSLSTSDANNVVEPGELVTLTVHAEDPDCVDSCSDGCGMVIVSDLTEWSADGGVLSGEDNGTTGSPYTAAIQWEAPAAVGTYTIGVSLSDNGDTCDGPGSAADSVSIVVNNRPYAVSDLIFSPGPDDSPAAAAGNLLADNGYGTDYDVDGDPLYVYGFYNNYPLPEDGSFVCDPSRDFEVCVNRSGEVTCSFLSDWNDLSEGEISGIEYEYWLTDGKSVNFMSDLDSHYGKFACFVRGENDPPAAPDGTLFLPEDFSPRSFTVSHGDPDWEDTWTFSFDCPGCKAPDHGTVEPTGGDGGEYRPDQDYAGGDSFGFQVCDNHDACDTGLVVVTIAPVNDSPVIGALCPDWATEGAIYSCDADVTDVDGPSATWSVEGASDTCGGEAAAETGVYTFTPTGPSLPSECVLSLRVCDGGTPEECDIESATVAIRAIKDIPNDVVFDFGSADGVWAWKNGDAGAWAAVSGMDPELTAMGDLDGNGQDDVILGFGGVYGVWVRYNNDAGSWASVTGMNPEAMSVGDLDGNGQDDVIFDFGGTYGAWAWYNGDAGSWAAVSGLDPELIAMGDLDGSGQDDAVFDFGGTYGVWAWYNNDAGSWAPVTGLSPETMGIGDLDGSGQDDAVMGFGAAHGVWAWYNNDPAHWTFLTEVEPESICSGDLDFDGKDEVIFDFGPAGIWALHNNDPADWRNVSGLDPELIGVGDLDNSGRDELIVDYGAAHGIWVLYDGDTGSWKPISGLSPEEIACGNMDGN